MSTIVIILVVLVALVIALLAAPITVTLDVERVEAFAARWRLRWAYGLVRVGSRDSSSRPTNTVLTGQRASTPPAIQAEPEQTAEDNDDAARADRPKRQLRKKAHGAGGRVVLAVMCTPGFLGRVGRLTRALIGRVRIEQFRLRAAFGLSDPADTGMMYGLLSPGLVIATVYHLDVECRPVFDQAGVRLTLKASVRVVPLAVAITVLAFLLSPPVIRALLAARRARSS